MTTAQRARGAAASESSQAALAPRCYHGGMEPASSSPVGTLSIDVWSDLACPWCYVGKRRLEAALAELEHSERARVRWRSFELDASAPPLVEGDYVARLGKKYRVSRDEAQAMIDRMTATAAAEGITMRFDRVRAGNTFAAHKLVHAAAARGLDDAMKERLFAAYFTEGKALSDRDTLLDLAADVGLPEAAAALDDPKLGADVRADQALARELGISSVPFFVLGEQVGIPGAQPAAVLLAELRALWARRAVEPASAAASAAADGETCGPRGCA